MECSDIRGGRAAFLSMRGSEISSTAIMTQMKRSSNSSCNTVYGSGRKAIPEWLTGYSCRGKSTARLRRSFHYENRVSGSKRSDHTKLAHPGAGPVGTAREECAFAYP